MRPKTVTAIYVFHNKLTSIFFLARDYQNSINIPFHNTSSNKTDIVNTRSLPGNIPQDVASGLNQGT